MIQTDMTFRKRLAGFSDDRRGVIAVVFALTLFPMMVLAGGAIDYSTAVKKKTRLQQALDSGILAAAVRGTPDTEFMKNYMTANLVGENVSVSSATLTKTTGAGGAVSYTGAANFGVQTNFLKLIGLTSIPITANSEALLPGQIITATFAPLNAQGAFAKDIFLWTKDASGVITSKQNILNYRYGVSGSGTMPPIGNWTATFTVPKYSTYGVGMVVYQDLTYTGQMVNPVEMYSDVNPETFVQKTGNCSDAAGAQYNMEDGGDGNFVDFIYTMKCTTGVAPNTTARLSR